MAAFANPLIARYMLVGSSAQLRFGPILQKLNIDIADLENDTRTTKQTLQFQSVEDLEDVGSEPLDFLWITRSEKQFEKFKNAICYNHLSGTSVLEDKGNLSLVHSRNVDEDGTRALQTFLVKGSSGFMKWCERNKELLENGRMWIAKDPGANGAAGLWIFREGMLNEVAPQLDPNVEYVIQEYINNPMLWNDRKFHFRCYGVLKGDMQLFIYRRAFIHAANQVYDFGNADAIRDDVHITNCCANKGDELFAGEVVVDLEHDYPNLFPKLQQMFRKLANDISPFMKHQRCGEHFEYIGFDVMADSDGNVWLIEANCPPGMDTATGLKHAEDFHDEVVTSLIHSFIVQPVLKSKVSSFSKFESPRTSGWVSVNQPRTDFEPTTSKAMLALNALALALFRKKAAREF